MILIFMNTLLRFQRYAPYIQEQRQASREAFDKIKPVFDFNKNLDSVREFERLLEPA